MNIAQSVERAAHWFAEQPAILAEGATVTYRELNADASRLANALRAHGVQRGDRVALYLPNIAAFAVCYLGALKVGAIAVSINAIFKSDEVEAHPHRLGASVLFTVGDLLAHVPRRECPALAHVVVCEGDAQGNPALDDWLSRASSDGARGGSRSRRGRGAALHLGHHGQRPRARRSATATSSSTATPPRTTWVCGPPTGRCSSCPSSTSSARTRS